MKHQLFRDALYVQLHTALTIQNVDCQRGRLRVGRAAIVDAGVGGARAADDELAHWGRTGIEYSALSSESPGSNMYNWLDF